MKEKKEDKKTHRWSLNLTSWCLSHWSMIMIFFEQYLSTFFLSCYPVLIMVNFSGSMFLLWSHKHGPLFYFRQYTFLFVCLFLYILAVPEWQKYLECESLCSSCTRTEIIAMIIKKNMTKLYMHHVRGGFSVLLYRHPWKRVSFVREDHFTGQNVCFVLCSEYSTCFLLVPVLWF